MKWLKLLLSYMNPPVIDTELENVRLALIFKDFAVWLRSSCVGLNVAGYTTANYLKEHGLENVSIYPVRHNVDVVDAINKYNETHSERLTHVVISAPWLSVYDMKCLLENFSDIKFVILSHSNVGFLQADPTGVELLRKYAELSRTYKNIKVGGNCAQFVEWFKAAYTEECVLLPNLYPVERVKSKVWEGGPLKIGAFGAIRAEKNFMTAAAAAMVIHTQLGVPVEFHMSTGGEGCKSVTLPAIEQMFEGVEGVKLIRHDWAYWDTFVKLVGSMDLLIQVSYTESFNMVTADGISQGVPSVVSPVIRWAPDHWKANPDDAVDVAKVGMNLLLNNQYTYGSRALQAHNANGFLHWARFLKD